MHSNTKLSQRFCHRCLDTSAEDTLPRLLPASHTYTASINGNTKPVMRGTFCNQLGGICGLLKVFSFSNIGIYFMFQIVHRVSLRQAGMHYA